MKSRIIFLLFVFFAIPAVAQPSATQCIANIQKRLDALGPQPDFDFLRARQIIRDFDFGKVSDFATNAGKRSAFQRVWTSLSEFCDAAGNSLSGKGMKGYTKQSGLLINSSDLSKTEHNIAKFKEAFTQGGNFKGADFDSVMSKLGDSSKFDFDGVTGTFTSTGNVKYKFTKHPNGSYGSQPGGFGVEPDAISHIIRGHTPNDLNAGGTKSVFDDAKKVLDYIDEAMNAPIASRIPQGNGFVVELAAPVIGTARATASTAAGPTRKIFILLRSGTTDTIHTAYPF